MATVDIDQEFGGFADIHIEEGTVAMEFLDEVPFGGAGIVVTTDGEGAWSLCLTGYTSEDDEDGLSIRLHRLADGSLQARLPFHDPVWIEGPMATIRTGDGQS